MAARLGVALVVASAAGMWAAPNAVAATAPGSSMQLSVDGVHWSSTPPASLFAPDYLLVPGDMLQATLYLRSVRAEPSLLTVAVGDPAASVARYASDLHVSAADGNGEGLDSVSLASLAPCAHLVPSRVVERNEVVSVAIAVSLPASSANQTQAARADMTVEVGMSDAEPGGLDPFGCPADPVVVPSQSTSSGIPAAAPAGGPSGSATAAGTDARNSPSFAVSGFAVPFAERIAPEGGDLFYPALIIGITAVGAGWWMLLGKRRRRVRGGGG